MTGYEQTVPGWFFFNMEFPIYMIEGGPGSWPYKVPIKKETGCFCFLFILRGDK